MCLCAVQCMQTLDTGYLDHLVLVKLWIKVTRSVRFWGRLPGARRAGQILGASYLERAVMVRPWIQVTWIAP